MYSFLNIGLWKQSTDHGYPKYIFPVAVDKATTTFENWYIFKTQNVSVLSSLSTEESILCNLFMPANRVLSFLLQMYVKLKRESYSMWCTVLGRRRREREFGLRTYRDSELKVTVFFGRQINSKRNENTRKRNCSSRPRDNASRRLALPFVR